MIYNFFKRFIFILKYLLRDPLNFFFDLNKDFKKDKNSHKHKSTHYLVWCAGLPKSGSTLIEEIFEELPYVRVDQSLIRSFNNENLDHPHAIGENFFSSLPDKKYSFLKTHTHYKKEYLNIAKKHEARIIISLRDIRDVMISRYHHVLLDKNHWQHKYIYGLSFNEGFPRSLLQKKDQDYYKPIDLVYYWIRDWLKISREHDLLVLWYEDYIDNPINYINKILTYIGFQNYSANDIHSNILLNLKLKQKGLKANLSRFGRRKSTFRKGIKGEWEKHFDENMKKIFHSSLPGPIENILK